MLKFEEGLADKFLFALPYMLIAWYMLCCLIMDMFTKFILRLGNWKLSCLDKKKKEINLNGFCFNK